MSIYSSRVTVGHDAFQRQDIGRVVAHPDNRLALVYGEHWPAGHVSTASIPPWCAPGHEEDWDGAECAPWLRLTVSAGGLYGDVLMDSGAARALAADLLAWADEPKVSEPEQTEQP